MNNELCINGTLVPKDISMPTHVDIYGIGGMRVVETSQEMNDIPTVFKKDGMLVNVSTEDTLYKWDESAGEWKTFKITDDMIENNSIDGSKLIDNSITPDKLVGGSIDGSKIKYGSITTEKLALRSIKGINIAQNTITSDQLSFGSITVDAIAPNTITGEKIADNSINGNAIQSSTVNGNKLANHSITKDKLGPGISLMAKPLLNSAISGSYLADGGVNSISLSGYIDDEYTGPCMMYLDIKFIDVKTKLTGSGDWLRFYVADIDEYSSNYCGGTAMVYIDSTTLSESASGSIPQTILIGRTSSDSILKFKVSSNHDSTSFTIAIKPITYIPLEIT